MPRPNGQGALGYEIESTMANGTPNLGYYEDDVLDVLSDIRVAATGITLTASTIPAIAVDGGGQLTAVFAADASSRTALIGPYGVPGEFNDVSKEFSLRMLLLKAGTADAITITPTLLARSPNGAVKTIPCVSTKLFATDGVGTLASGTTALIIPAAGTTNPLEAVFNFTPAVTQAAPYLGARDAVTFSIAVTAHSTDALAIYDIRTRYARFSNMAPRVANGTRVFASRFDLSSN